MSAKISDVAAAAGVSTSTVSRAFSAPDMVEAVTLARVLRVAAECGYVPNRAARGLITGRTGNIGLLLPDIANPFFPSILKAIERRAMEADYQIFLADTDEKKDVELGFVKSLAKQVDGMILCSPRMDPVQIREAASSLPIVLVNRRSGLLPSITVDNESGLRMVVDHLADLGHAHLGYVAGPRSSWSSQVRRRSLRSASELRETELVELGHFEPMFDGGRRSCAKVLQSGITAVIAYNDLMAMGLCYELRESGREVPADLSVVGIDDIPMASMMHPALTTLSIPRRRRDAQRSSSSSSS